LIVGGAIAACSGVTIATCAPSRRTRIAAAGTTSGRLGLDPDKSTLA
jgi:hypothetical protein